MRPLPPAPLDVRGAARLAAKHRRSLVAGALLGCALFAAASPLAPRKYKSHFVLAVYAKYFQSPLVGDFVPSSESGDPGAQREALIRQALTPEYLDSLGRRYGIYPSAAAPPASGLRDALSRLKAALGDPGAGRSDGTDRRASAQRQALLGSIEVFALNDTTFNVGFSHPDPRTAYAATQDLHEQVLRSLLEARRGSLVTVRDAIQNRLGGLSASMAAPRPESPVEKELRSVRGQLERLGVAYTPAHPLMRRLRQREKVLAELLGDPPGGGAAPAPPAQGKEAEAAREVASDLVKKLNYLLIAIDSDQQRAGDYFATLESPMYPTSSVGMTGPMLAGTGLLLGLVCAAFIAVLREYFERSAVRTGVLAGLLGLPVLGELPRFPEGPRAS